MDSNPTKISLMEKETKEHKERPSLWQKRQEVSDSSGTVVNMEQDKDWKQGRDKMRWGCRFQEAT